jgi:preprotein translocase subunit SecY
MQMSTRTRLNWLIDAAVFLGGVLAALSGIYFLYVPSGGYRGGRNPTYGVTILFSRATWADLHTWGGVVMVIAAVVHFSIHWSWVKTMSKRVGKKLVSKGPRTSRGSNVNLIVDGVVFVSGVLAAASGIYFLYAPTGGYDGGLNPGWDPGFLFSRTTWDLIHTWAGVVFVIAVVVHFAIHWGWVSKVTARFFKKQESCPEPREVPAVL